MDLRVSVRGVEKPEALRAFAEERAAKGLARFDKKILGATMRLQDETGAERKGLDKTCSIEVKEVGPRVSPRRIAFVLLAGTLILILVAMLVRGVRPTQPQSSFPPESASAGPSPVTPLSPVVPLESSPITDGLPEGRVIDLENLERDGGDVYAKARLPDRPD